MTLPCNNDTGAPHAPPAGAKVPDTGLSPSASSKQVMDALRVAVENMDGILWVIDKEMRFTVAEGRRLDVLGVTPGQLVGASMTDVMSADDPAVARARRVLNGETLSFETARGETNEAASEITGYTREELVGMHPSQLVFEDDRAAAAAFRERLDSSGRASAELRCLRKDKRVRACMVEAVQLSDTQVLGFLKDITAYKQMADALRHAEKMQAVGELAGGIAHDFNNQLLGILGYAEFLKEAAGHNETLTGYANKIITAVKRASDLTAEMLAFSRKGKFLDVTVDMHRIVVEVVNLLSHSIDKKVVIEQALEATPATTKGDPSQVQNAVLNLALNARDAMPDGGTLGFATDTVVLDKAACERMPFDLQPGPYLRLSVKDTGAGIPEAIRARIFEPFFTTKETGKGTGMGLAAVYGTVKSHKGAISVDTKPGEGTCFVMHLPLVSEPPVTCEETPDTTQSGTAHILLVEDEPMVREVVSKILTGLGYTVTACENGRDAVVHYRDHHARVDLVIIDVVMPEMDGEETFDAMAAIDPNVRVLVSSGYSLDGKAQRIIKKGAKGFLQKPFRRGELAIAVAEILGR